MHSSQVGSCIKTGHITLIRWAGILGSWDFHGNYSPDHYPVVDGFKYQDACRNVHPYTPCV